MTHDDGVDHLTSGMRLPPLALPATGSTTVTLAEQPGRSLVVVYPWTGRPGQPNPPNWDNIPGAHGSTPELEGFRDHHAGFLQCGIRIFALSRQATDYQRELVERLALPFPILSDVQGRFAASLRLPHFVTGGETYLKRLTLLVEGGRLEHVFFPVADPASHAADLVAWLAAQG